MPFGDSLGAAEQFLAFLETQRIAFRAGLPGKLAELDRLWQRAVRGPENAAAIDDLERLAHNLAGSGATFGLRDLSAAARALETAVQELRLPPPACEPRLDVATALGNVRRCIA